MNGIDLYAKKYMILLKKKKNIVSLLHYSKKYGHRMVNYTKQ